MAADGVYSIECKNVSLAYDAAVAVQKVHCLIEKGDYLCIVGENGSGKSTLLKGILGLLHPVCGAIVKNGVKHNEMGFLPQQKTAQKDFPAGVFEVVLSGRLGSRGMNPFYSSRDKETAKKNMALLGIGHLAHTCFRELSGGQQQRVLLARALCGSDKIIVLDEPVAGLDPLISADMYRILSDQNRERELTVIMVSHDIAGAVSHANKILHLKNEPLFFGTTREYIQSEVGRSFLATAGGGKNA